MVSNAERFVLLYCEIFSLFCLPLFSEIFTLKLTAPQKIQKQQVSENEELISVSDPKTVKSHKQRHQTVVHQILVPSRGPSKFSGKSVSSPVEAQLNLRVDEQHNGEGLFRSFAH